MPCEQGQQKQQQQRQQQQQQQQQPLQQQQQPYSRASLPSLAPVCPDPLPTPAASAYTFPALSP